MKFVYIIDKSGVPIIGHMFSDNYFSDGPQNTLCHVEFQHLLSDKQRKDGWRTRSVKNRKVDVDLCPDCQNEHKIQLAEQYPWLKGWAK